MADKGKDENNGIEGRPPDPFVAARINDPGTPAPASFQLSGLLGDSDREGVRRLYLNTTLDYYVEFRNEDVLGVESVAPDQAPFVGLDATRVTLKRDAQIEYVRSQAAAGDAFAVDAQVGLPGGGFIPDPGDPDGTITGFTPGLPQTPFGCVPDTLPPQCRLETLQGTCIGCVTQKGTCIGCITKNATCWITQCQTCDNATCRTCFGATCQTCDQATCQTCGQATCQTCDQATCQTCNPQQGCFPPVTTFANATCQTCLVACWKTVAGNNCITFPTVCNLTCQQTLDVGCISQRVCPTMKCPVR